MTKRQRLLFSLVRKRFRASYNKFNLLNAFHNSYANKSRSANTLYQQIWAAKSETRAYHGEQMNEKKWQNIFESKLKAVSPLKSASSLESSKASVTPWALQAYMPVERRLDMAIFRAMFASSPRQAAQFIKFGRVTVNGVKIKHAGYPLKPGDVFAVEPERVLYAMGRQKPTVKDSVELINRQITRYNKYLARCKKYPELMWKARQRRRIRHPRYDAQYQANIKKRIAAQNEAALSDMKKSINSLTPSSVLKSLLLEKPYFLANAKLPDFGYGQADQNKALSAFRLVTGIDPKQVEASINANAAEGDKQDDSAQPIKASSEDVDAVVKSYFPPKDVESPSLPPSRADVKKILLEIIKIRSEHIQQEHRKLIKNADSEKEEYDEKWVERLGNPLPLVDAEQAQQDLQSVLPVALPWTSGGLYGLQDPGKGYFTPWSPRPFLSPFAILPHHIEISFDTCHAVYLRDPVARPNNAEIISPFSLDMHERAYMFYNRRRRK